MRAPMQIRVVDVLRKLVADRLAHSDLPTRSFGAADPAVSIRRFTPRSGLAILSPNNFSSLPNLKVPAMPRCSSCGASADAIAAALAPAGRTPTVLGDSGRRLARNQLQACQSIVPGRGAARRWHLERPCGALLSEGARLRWLR